MLSNDFREPLFFFFYVFSLVHKMKRKRTPVRDLFNDDSVQKSHSMKLLNLKCKSNISL